MDLQNKSMNPLQEDNNKSISQLKAVMRQY